MYKRYGFKRSNTIVYSNIRKSALTSLDCQYQSWFINTNLRCNKFRLLATASRKADRDLLLISARASIVAASSALCGISSNIVCCGFSLFAGDTTAGEIAVGEIASGEAALNAALGELSPPLGEALFGEPMAVSKPGEAVAAEFVLGVG
jgi:hypothetical protein